MGSQQPGPEIPSHVKLKERQIVSGFSRQELEDRYLKLQDQNMDLKKNVHGLEVKMKKMATKLLRLVKDKKQLDEVGLSDIELKDKIVELETTVGTLRKQNEQLKNKLTVAKQQLQTHGKKPSAYDHVKSRVFTLPVRQQRIKEQLRVQGPTPSPTKESYKSPHPVLPQPRYGHSLLEESRMEKREMEDLISGLRYQLEEYEKKISDLQGQVHQNEVYHEEEKQHLRQTLSGTQRSNIKENVELIKLQREVKDKVAKLQNLQGKYQNLDEALNKVKLSHQQVLEDMDSMTAKLKQEQQKNSELTNQLRNGNLSQQTMLLKDEQINDLQTEVALLQQAHEKLLHSTFDTERGKEFRIKEKKYQLHIAQLEEVIKSGVSDKNDVLDRLTVERDTSDVSQKQFRELQVKYYAIKEKHDDLAEKMKFFSGESETDFEEVQEALLLVKTRKEKASQDLNFLEDVDNEVNRDVRKEIQELQAAHADTITELEKTRSMLLIQHNINKDYQKEVEMTSKQMEDLKKEYDSQIEEYAQLLDIRAERIKKLEAQLHDTAYGTKQYSIKHDDSIDTPSDEIETMNLERGQNVFEIHIGKINISRDGEEEFDGVEPTFFVSYEFFEYELQVTPVARGFRTDVNHTSQYVTKVDDFFIHYLQKESMDVEFHQALGTEYRTIARGSVRFNEVLNTSHGRIHGKISLLNTRTSRDIVHIEYWMRLCVPMEQALRLYKERVKALGYVTSNNLEQLDGPTSEKSSDPGINTLSISIKQCWKLKSNLKDVQPCPYCVYKFFDFDDHDTDIIQNSFSPQFYDERTYKVAMTEELDNFLRSSTLDIYVFDDADPEATNYIGKSAISLVSLSQGKPITGQFQLFNKSEESSGSIELTISWKSSYAPGVAKKERKYPKPVQQNQVDRDVDDNTIPVHHKQNNSRMQPMVSAGKLFEPNIVGDDRVERDDNDDRRSSSIAKDERDEKVTQKQSSMDSGTKRKHASTINEIDDDEEDDERESALQLAADTLFAEEEEESEEEVVIPTSSRQPAQRQQPGAGQSNSETSLMSGDTDDDVIVATSRLTSTPHGKFLPPTITIIVTSLTLHADTPVYERQDIKQLFVSYKFLDFDPEQLETPMSMPKPKPDRPISFNFKKVFRIDDEDNETSRQFLMHLLMPDHPNEGRIFFTVVSDPMDEEDEDCEDVGIAYVDLIQLMRDGQDLIDVDVDVYDLLGSDGDVMGSLTVTVEALSAIQSLYE